jgi:hypothetical protein
MEGGGAYEGFERAEAWELDPETDEVIRELEAWHLPNTDQIFYKHIEHIIYASIDMLNKMKGKSGSIDDILDSSY